MRNAVLLVVVGLVLSIGTASATVPDPSLCSVDPTDTRLVITTTPQYRGAVLDPPAGTEFTVNVRNASDQPIPNAFVSVVALVPGNHVECANIVASGNTDGDGNITFNLAMGGCTYGVDAVDIVANTVTIRTYQALVSPDQDASGAVSLGDFTAFAAAYSAGAPGCHDYDGSGACGLSDFTLFGQCFNLTCDPS